MQTLMLACRDGQPGTHSRTVKIRLWNEEESRPPQMCILPDHSAVEKYSYCREADKSPARRTHLYTGISRGEHPMESDTMILDASRQRDPRPGRKCGTETTSSYSPGMTSYILIPSREMAHVSPAKQE